MIELPRLITQRTNSLPIDANIVTQFLKQGAYSNAAPIVAFLTDNYGSEFVYVSNSSHIVEYCFQVGFFDYRHRKPRLLKPNKITSNKALFDSSIFAVGDCSFALKVIKNEIGQFAPAGLLEIQVRETVNERPTSIFWNLFFGEFLSVAAVDNDVWEMVVFENLCSVFKWQERKRTALTPA